MQSIKQRKSKLFGICFIGNNGVGKWKRTAWSVCLTGFDSPLPPCLQIIFDSNEEIARSAEEGDDGECPSQIDAPPIYIKEEEADAEYERREENSPDAHHIR